MRNLLGATVQHASALGRFLKRLLAEILIGVFGRIEWQAPAWLRLLTQPLRWLQIQSSQWRQRSPRLFWGSLATLIVLLMAGEAGRRWYESQPKPERYTVSSNTLSATQLIENPSIDNLRLEFSGSVARLEDIDKKIVLGPKTFTMKPTLKGEWKWASDKVLIFAPSEDWGVGQEYTVSFAKEFFPAKVLLEDYDYKFKSADFSLWVSQQEFYTDPKDPKLKKVLATFVATHPIAADSFQEHLVLRKKQKKRGKFELSSDKVPFTVTYNKFSGEAYVQSENLPIPKDDETMVITLEKGVQSTRGGDGAAKEIAAEVEIPSMYSYFKINSAEAAYARNEQYEPEPVLVIDTSAGTQQELLSKKLTVQLLPQDRPAATGREPQKNYHWQSTAELTGDVMRLAKTVKLNPVPTDKEWATLISFKHDIKPGRFLYVKIDKGLKAYGDYELARPFEAIVEVPELPKELTIMHDGSLLSLTGERKISLMARGVSDARLEIGRIRPSEISHLVTQTYGNFQKPNFNNWNFNKDNLIERFTEYRKFEVDTNAAKAQYTALDLTSYMNREGARRGLFYLTVESWNEDSKSASFPKDERLILITDMGLVAKRAVDGSQDVFVMSISSGQPVGSAKVEVLGKNGLPILSAITDAQGHVNFPKLSDFTREKQPTVYLATKGEDLAFLPFDRGDRNLNLSRFDVGGEYSNSVEGQLSAYIFSDRGIYRPGDTMNLGLIVRAADWSRNLVGLPLEVIITDARGLTVLKKKIELGKEAFEELSYTTRENSPTGDYQISLYVIRDNEKNRDFIGSTTVRVEEFLPDRMRINATFSKLRSEGWVSPDDLAVNVSLQNLFGTPAADRRTTGNMTLVPWAPAFTAYRDYFFFDPAKAKNSYSEAVDEQKTNEKGEAQFKLALNRFADATYKLVFRTEGFEAEGGRAVTARAAILVSPNEYLVGYKPDGDNTFIAKDSARSVDLIAVDSELKKIAVQDLKAHLIELRYVSVLTKQSSGVYKYESVRKELTVSNRPLALAASGLKYKLATDKPGSFALVIRNAQDKELNRVEYTVMGASNLAGNLERNAELQIKLDRTDYAAGENIQIDIKAPYVGAGLITIERDNVRAFKWFTAKTTNSIQSIAVPAGLEGNGYVNVSFVRDIGSKEIFVSPLSYGVAAFSVSREQRINHITLKTPELVKPGETLKISYATQRPGKIVVYGVDEGILQVARYKIPDPLGSFFKKKALEVQTFQILDLILPEFSLVREFAAPGGDADGMLGANLNPFKRKRQKPVAFWSGILEASSTAKEWTYEVPDYFNGSIKVMAVAVSSDAIGVAKEDVTVRGPFVINPNVPSFIAPGDEAVISVAVANNIEASGEKSPIKLSLKTSEHLAIIGDDSQTLTIAAGREGTALFKVKANAKQLGSGNLTFTASLNDQKASFETDVSVRPVSPRYTTLKTGSFKDDHETVKIERNMHTDHRLLEASISVVPLGLAKGLSTYLENYQYQCTEQLVSALIPQIFLSHREEFGYTRQTIETKFATLIDTLRSRQNEAGAFGMWTANAVVNDDVTAYVTQALLEAKDRGLPVPADMLDRSLAYLRDSLTQPATNLATARTQAYAIYLLSRAQLNSTILTNHLDGLLSQLREREDQQWENDLTGSYLAAAFKILKQDEEANKLIGAVKFGVKSIKEPSTFFIPLSNDAQLLYLLAKHFPERVASLQADAVESMLGQLSKGAYNTLGSAYTVMALDAYAEAASPETVRTMAIKEILDNQKQQALPLSKGLFGKANFSDKATALDFSAGGKGPVFYQILSSGFDRDLPTVAIKQKLEVVREFRDEKNNPVTTAKLGDKLTVHVRVRAIDENHYANIAVVDLLPAGFEVEVNRTENVSPIGGEESTGEAEGEAGGEEGVHEASSASWISPIADASSTWMTDYVDAREDRVVIFGSVTKDMVDFVYKIRATNSGSFQIPPIYAESMYEPGVQALSLGGQMTVEAR